MKNTFFEVVVRVPQFLAKCGFKCVIHPHGPLKQISGICFGYFECLEVSLHRVKTSIKLHCVMENTLVCLIANIALNVALRPDQMVASLTYTPLIALGHSMKSSKMVGALLKHSHALRTPVSCKECQRCRSARQSRPLGQRRSNTHHIVLKSNGEDGVMLMCMEIYFSKNVLP